MRHSLPALACVVVAVSCATQTATTENAGTPCAKELFDGRSLAGWDGDARFWSVEDGAIVGHTTPENPCNETTYLVWRGGEVGDFELACEFKLEGGNSGVQFRSRDLGEHKVAGYQADLEDGPNWTGCLYEQDGRGVMAKRGERVVFDPERHAVALDDAAALLARVRKNDWNEYVIRAVGPRIELDINGVRMLEVVDRDKAHAASRGVLALQLHQGAPMRVAFRNLRLRELASEPDNAPAPAVAALTWSGPPPQWIWTHADAGDGEVAAFRREFDVPFDVAHATLRFAGDDHARVFVRDAFVRQSDQWWTPVELDVTRSLARGANTLALVGKNDGSVAAAWLELVAEGTHGERLRVITDASWACEPLASGASFEAWKPGDFEHSRASAAHSFGAYGVEPWASTGAAMRGEPAPVVASNDTSRALDASQLTLPAGFRAELLYSVPKSEQGSWVAMCEDGRGRLIVSDQYGGLYRVAPPPLGGDAATTKVEHLPLELDSAQGLCWAFDSLYVVVSSTGKRDSGLYRVRDTDGDGELDDVKLLRKFDGSGEHGPHAVVLAPDGKHLWVIAGNHTKLPEPIDVYRLPKTWGEDHLLPVIEDPNGHAVGIRAPGGWVVRTDENGERWELWAGGLRNAYDLAFDDEGEAFTYDSDMEWDMGAPWYKPPRFVHLVSGADFGWRSGTANWPVDYPDTLPSVCETGPSSPTGMVFGTNAKFPQEYRRALFALDWAYGTIYALHLEPKGSSFTGTAEKFATGKPFPVTDVVVARDGAMYVTTGGRKTQSGLYRITWGGALERRTTPRPVADVVALVETRHTVSVSRDPIAQLHGMAIVEPSHDVVELAIKRLGSHDPFAAQSARVALERCAVQDWSPTPPELFDGRRSVELAIASLHAAPSETSVAVLSTIDSIPIEDLSEDAELDALRLYELALIRLPPIDVERTAKWRARFEAMSLSGEHTRTNRELAMLLVALDSPKVIGPLLATMEGDASQEEKIHALYCLRALKSGWTLPERRRFLTATDALRAVAKGGFSLKKYLDVMRKQVVDSLGDSERRALEDLLEPPKTDAPAAAAPASFVKRWTKDDLLAELRAPLRERSFEHGKSAFAKASCAQCHRIAGEGGATGPDLTGAASRFGASDLVEAIVEPSKAISDQYQDTEVRTKDGELYVGRVEGEHSGKLVFRRLPPEEDVIELDTAEIESRRLTPLSRMPSGLLDVLTRDEVLDLFAYVLAGGDAANAAFR